jgi:hypothetical protein
MSTDPADERPDKSDNIMPDADEDMLCWVAPRRAGHQTALQDHLPAVRCYEGLQRSIESERRFDASAP